MFWPALILVLIVIPASIQFLLWGPVLQRLLRWQFGQKITIGFDGPGFILPFLLFRARNFRFMIHANDEHHDRVYLEADKLNFVVDPLMLLFGRLRIVNLDCRSPYFEYFNRVESFKKNHLLPGRHRVEIKNAHLYNGRIYVRDETMTPIYRLELNNIELYNMDMDLSTPVDLFFRTKRGSAQIGSGRVEIGRDQSGNSGYIRLWGLTWGELASIQNIPLMGTRLALSVHHSGGSRSRFVTGQIGYSTTSGESTLHPGEDKDRMSIPFSFDVDWDDYKMTIDLGLQRLIGSILENAQTNWLSSGFVLGGRGVFQIMKKPDGKDNS